MREDELPPEKAAARDELNDWIQGHAGQLGPWDEEGADIGPIGSLPLLDGWVLMTNWVDEDGHSFLVRMPSRNLPTHARVGLLHEGIYGFED